MLSGWATLYCLFGILIAIGNPKLLEVEMILSAHAVVGGAIASLFPSHPLAVIAAAFASHFAIDAIPHWDYPLQSIKVGAGARNQLKLARPILLDLALIGFDAFAGLALAVVVFATPATIGTVILGASAAIMPDPLQFLYSLYPREPLKSLQQFHSWIHSKCGLNWPLGISSQIAFVALVIGIMIEVSAAR
jgi:hypothetical protein